MLIGTLGPYLVKGSDNPEGVDPKVFDGIRAGLRADRPATLMEFLKNFYSVGGADGERVSERVIEANWAVGIGASPIGTLSCVDAWIEDFRADTAGLPAGMLADALEVRVELSGRTQYLEDWRFRRVAGLFRRK